MNNEKNLSSTSDSETTEVNNRRDALKKLGKYSAYVAPFTVLALTAKAGTGGSSGTPHFKK